MVISTVKGNNNKFSKIPIAGIIEEYCVKKSTTIDKIGKESLEIHLRVVDDNLELTDRTWTVFLSMGTKGWEDRDGIMTPPSYAEVNGLIVFAGTQGSSVSIDYEKIDSDQCKYEINDLVFDPDIIGAYVKFGVKPSKKNDAGESFMNYTVEEFELKGIPNKPQEKPSAPANGRRARAPLNARSSEAIKIGYTARVEFREYLRFHSEELSEIITAKKLLANIDEYEFSSEDVKTWIIDNLDKLIEESIDEGSLVSGSDGPGKYRFLDITDGE